MEVNNFWGPAPMVSFGSVTHSPENREFRNIAF